MAFTAQHGFAQLFHGVFRVVAERLDVGVDSTGADSGGYGAVYV